MHFFTFLGTGGYSECRYHYHHRGADFTSPPVAFVQTATALLYADDIERFTVFATEKAEDTNRQKLELELRSHGVTTDPEFVRVPDGHDQAEMVEFFTILAEHLKDSRRLLADITHGFRSQPALGLLILNYLQSVYADTRVEDIVYGAFDRERMLASKDGNQTVFRLVSLLDLWELNQWAAGFRIFRQTGDVTTLSALAEEIQRREGRARNPDVRNLPFITFAGALNVWSENAELCAVPQMYAPDGSLAGLLRALEEPWHPAGEELGRVVAPLRDHMREALAPMKAERWDSLDGLRAQIELMRWLASYKRFQPMLTIAREWLVTAVAIVYGMDATKQRKKVDAIFGKLSQPRIPADDPHAARMGEVFTNTAKKVSNVRNKVNHGWTSEHASGTGPRTVGGSVQTQSQEILEALTTILDELTVIMQDGPLEHPDTAESDERAGTTLFSPLGRSPGVLYTAIAHHRPRRVAILTSREGLQALEELRARLRADLDHVPDFHHALVDDPFADFEAARRAGLDLARHVGGANVVNIAGGTTALQFGIQALADSLEARCGAVIDRRTLDEQRAEPYHVGEWVWLDTPPA